MGWERIMVGQSPPFVDWMLMVLFTLAALTQYVAIARCGSGSYLWRSLAAFGWSLWATRFWWAFLAGDDPVVPPVGATAITFIVCASILQNVREGRCDPNFPDQHPRI